MTDPSKFWQAAKTVSDMTSEPRPAATILLLRDEPAFEVLMVKRHHQIDFASGALYSPAARPILKMAMQVGRVRRSAGKGSTTSSASGSSLPFGERSRSPAFSWRVGRGEGRA